VVKVFILVPNTGTSLVWLNMNASIRSGTIIAMLVVASLCGCRAMGQFALNSPTTMFRMASSMFSHKPEVVAAPPATALAARGSEATHSEDTGSEDTHSEATHSYPNIDAYKTDVAQHVVESNREQTFSGKLPAMVPAIVVLNITVDRNGNLADVQVQRYRDPSAAWVAVSSMRLADPLPKPDNLLATNTGLLTFSETFLFDSEYRFQLRSLAGPQ
jgi:protein TonB